ncbi:hypothetical protein KPH14_005482 [Odynerus spinipes]|uniref:Uncharacterized protein n=1 Tax=Odynerus spinipes TaxID=1348599 RepID=A0AAD9RCD2_9HYME|nr:hypothetical protein KPH14_005482 [Odynerus spinipes]
MSIRLPLVSIFSRTCVSLLILLARARTNEPEWKTNYVRKNTVCANEECLKYGKHLTEIMNPAVQPCNDFYEYVCGRWTKKHPLPPYFDEWSSDSEVQMKAFHRVREFLSEPIRDSDNADLRKAKKLYHECMKIPNYGIVDPSVIASTIKQIGYFPLMFNQKFHNKSWQGVHNYYLSFTGESGLFSIFLRGQWRKDYMPMLYVRETISPFGLVKDCEMTENQQRKYVKFLFALVKLVFPYEIRQLSQATLKKELSAIVAFRMQLYNIKMEALPTAGIYNPMTVFEMDHRYRLIMKGKKTRAKIDWIEIFQTFQGFEKKESVKSMTFSLENNIYIHLLAQLLSDTPENVIVNHVHLYFIERHTKLDSYLRTVLTDVILQGGNITGKIRYLGRKSPTCISINEMKDAIGKQYVIKYFSKTTKKQVEDLIKEIKQMLKMQIRESPWLNLLTMSMFQKKVDEMKTVIGYPEYYEDSFKILQNPSAATMSPMTIDAFFLVKSNLLSISAAYMNPPIFSPLLPYAVSYGALGEYISHEMYHGFGPHATDFYKSETPWLKKMVSMYDDKVRCFIKKFDKLPVHELKHMHPPPTINGYKTVEENIADTMGVKLAYWTFRKKVWDNKKCQVVPFLPNITCHQLFFISFASAYCSTVTMDTLMENLRDGVHITPRLRVNEAVFNFEEFNQLFDCPKTNHQAKRPTCDLWK